MNGDGEAAQNRGFIPRGAASFDIKHDGPPADIHFLLLPRLTMLALSSAIEPLRIANQVTGKELYRWFLMSGDDRPVRCSNGIEVVPNAPLANIPRGGQVFLCSGTEPGESVDARLLTWIGRQRAFGAALGGICTGAFGLARAGLLDGRVFTLHWENQPAFRELYPELEPTENLFEVDGELVTCAGGNAATDMMLNRIERDHGTELAAIVSDMCIHLRSGNRKAVQKSAYSAAWSSRNQKLITAMQVMEENLEEPVSIAEITHRVGLSRRQLERLFLRYVGVSPVQYYIGRRIERAHALLNETTLPVAEIAVATGFRTAAQLTKNFRRRYGRTPSAFRKSWNYADGS